MVHAMRNNPAILAAIFFFFMKWWAELILDFVL